MAFGESMHPLQTASILRGKIANTPASDTADLWVTVPSFHHAERWGPCPFAPRVNAAGAARCPTRATSSARPPARATASTR
jgi:hypothetical protein